MPGTPTIKGYDICSNPIYEPVDYYVIHWPAIGDSPGRWTCTCMSYVYSRARPKTCKHIGRCT